MGLTVVENRRGSKHLLYFLVAKTCESFGFSGFGFYFIFLNSNPEGICGPYGCFLQVFWSVILKGLYVYRNNEVKIFGRL